jgi:hypothetical protein
MTKAIAVSTPNDLIQSAITSGADLEKLEKLLTLQERWEANEAKKAYHRAMAEFKANPPDIEKDKKVSFGATKYNHASLANVTQKINAALSTHGLSASWQVKQNGQVSVTCKITHELGHSEETTLTAPADTSGSKNAIQSIGSTIAYLERYSILALCGLATREMDDDGKSSEVISAEEVNLVLEKLQEKEGNVVKFLKYMGLEKLEDMLKSDLKKALTAIENVRRKK